MSGNKKQPLVPRLRFPEFKEDWRLLPMSAVYTFRGNNSLSRDKLNCTNGPYRNIHYGDIHTKFAQHFHADAEPVPYINEGESHSTIRPENYCLAGDMVFADASEDMADIGKAIEIIDAGDVPLVSGLHTILARPNKGSMALGFGAYLFSSEILRKQIQREAQGAKVLGLSATRLGNVKLYYPSRLEEQQKIADCLSSLDDLIAAETQKLDTLKTHKKGLMQQLFPREGETVPRLRFPEFRNGLEYNFKPLNMLVKFFSGGTPSKVEPAYWGGDIPWISASSMHDVNIVDADLRVTTKAIGNGTRIAEKGSILILVRGSMLFKRVPICIALRDVAFNQDVKALTVMSDVISVFLLYQLISLSSRIAINETGIGAGKIETEALESLKVWLPDTAEQQKIADCLSSLDDLITAQTQKIDALKTHKKGLMQQLFPALDEVSA